MGAIMVSRVRIEDVAEAARVSMKTVSRVLNREPNVREETRERVLEAVQRLNYIPHFSARSLAGSKSFLVALLYNNPSDNYLMGVMSGALAACEQRDYAMLLCPVDTDVPELLERVEGLIRRSQPDGLIMTPPITDIPELRARLAEMQIPVACISPKDRVGSIGVGMDETQAACDMVQHLASLGHRRIAHISGHPAHGATGWRIAGYKLGLQRAGLDVDDSLLMPGEFSFESGARAAHELLAQKRRPTAIFAANDDMAAGVISVALEQGLRVPEDLSVCGFDDTPMSTQIFPPLTTVHQPTHEMGRLATLELLAAVQTPGSGRMLHVPYTLCVRRSSGPAPRR
ncbi:substrate-binding domain-containing protein [Lysobacter sp. HA18]